MATLSNITARFGRIACAVALLPAFCMPSFAQTADRWLADESEARATLPDLRDNANISSAELSCAAQRWTLRLELNGATVRAGSHAELRIDGNSFAARLAVEPRGLAIAVPRAALDPIKSGLRLEIGFPGELGQALGDLTFPLRGSMIAVTAVQDKCSLRDMSAYNAVTFTPYSSYINIARDLRAADIEAFALATASQPVLDAAMAEFGDGRQVLFTRLCGSSWYYGVSGCNITGFAPQLAVGSTDTETPAWRVVYDTENVTLHTDPNSASRGWPDLVTLPVRIASPGKVWRWGGDAYTLAGDLPETEEDGERLPLRLGQD